jgi:RluA family pseudouridine synthase
LIFKDYIPSTQGIKKAIKKGAIRVNDEVVGTGLWVEPNQKIELVDLENTPPKKYELALEVIFEDEYLAVINKPAGIVVSGNQYKTIQNALLFNLNPSQQKDALDWPLPVHRLDSPTSGLLLIAKTKQARIQLGQQFENKTIQKRYRAIAVGQIPESGEWNVPIEGAKGLTTFKTLKTIPSLQNEWLSLVDLFPHTGRTHQLRIHLSEAGFPIVGDKIYGKKGNILKGKGLFLTAVELKFIHPVHQNEVCLKIDMPHKFDSLIEREVRRWGKFKD